MNKSPFSLDSASIAIIGLGLLGGSLALSLKGYCRRLSALETHLPTYDLAPHTQRMRTKGEYAT